MLDELVSLEELVEDDLSGRVRPVLQERVRAGHGADVRQTGHAQGRHVHVVVGAIGGTECVRHWVVAHFGWYGRWNALWDAKVAHRRMG